MATGSFSVIRAMVVSLFLFAIAARGQSAPPAAPANAWPERLGERNLHPCEYGVVYARQKSSVAQIRKVLAVLTKDVKEEGLATPGAGLILVVDTRETYPCETARLLGVLKGADPNVMASGASAERIKEIAASEEKAGELGVDVSTVLALMPVPIRPGVLHEVVEGLPSDVEQRIEWCAVVSTDRRLKVAFKETLDAAMKKEKPGLAERVAIAALMPVVERKAMSMLKKGRQAGLYEVFVSMQKDLSPEQKRQRIEAYKDKLGLNEDFDPAKNRGEPAEAESDEPDSE